MRMQRLLVVILCGIVLSGCKKWEDHNAITDDALTNNLFQQISAETTLSKFTELLKRSGYDTVIASSRVFTVFAPTNDALATLDAGIVNDAAKLKAFVGSHIATQHYFTTSATAVTKIPMLNGKYHSMLNKTVDDAQISTADKYAKNGVLQVINKMLPALNNCWEALEYDATLPAKQKNYMLSLFRNVFDLTHAEQIGVNPVTGEPIYKPGTDSIRTNLFWRNVYDLRDESKEFTLFLLEDAAWDGEVNKFKVLCAANTVDSTTDFSSLETLKDLATDTLWQPATVRDTVYSKFRVKIPVTKTEIVRTVKTSNGIIYIMRKVDITLANKLQEIIIQGENYRTTLVDRRSNTYFRDRINTLTGKDYKDVMVFNHGVANFYLNYRLRNMYSVKYKAYWVAVNDFQAAAFSQKLAISDPATLLLPYTVVNANTFGEVYLGEFPLSTYQPVLDLYLTAANSTTAAVNPLVCDYIRLVPSL